MEKWVYDEEDAPSLSDLPVTVDRGDHLHDAGGTEEFEFFGGRRLCPESEDDRMCVADEVFFQWQILLPMDNRSCSSCPNGGTGGRMSRSESTDSSRPASIFSNFFYTRPSPRPHPSTGKQGFDVGRRRRRSASAMGILWFGLVRGPELELGCFRHRKVEGAFQGGRKVKAEKKPEKNGFGFLRNRLGCKYSPGDALEPISCCSSTRILVDDSTKEEAALASHSRRRRTVRWLEELSAPKGHDSY